MPASVDLPPRGRHAVHGRVEERPQPLHGQEELLREKHHEKRGLEADGAARKLPHRDDMCGTASGTSETRRLSNKITSEERAGVIREHGIVNHA